MNGTLSLLVAVAGEIWRDQAAVTLTLLRTCTVDCEEQQFMNEMVHMVLMLGDGRKTLLGPGGRDSETHLETSGAQSTN